jgi:flagellar biosynthesis protein FlhA
MVGWRLRKTAEVSDTAAPAQAPSASAKENLEALLKVEPLAVEVGLGLVGLVEGGASSALLRRIGGIRRQLATDLGYLLPPIRVTDNLSLRSREYLISLKGVEIARFELPAGCDLALGSSRALTPIEGVPARDPAFGLPAVWVQSTAVEAARSAGYTVVDAVSVLGTHLAEVIRRNAHELFSRQDAKRLLDRVAEENPKVVEDLVPKLLPLATVQKVLQNLLRERVSIRDAGSILEALGEAGAVTRNPVLLTEFVRQSIRRMVVKPYLNPGGDMAAWFLDPVTEREIESAVEHSENSSHLNLAPQRLREIVDGITRGVGATETPVVLLASSGARFFLRQLTEATAPNLVVLAHNEIPAGVKVLSLGMAR